MMGNSSADKNKCEHQWTICWDSLSRNADGSLSSLDLVCMYCGKLQTETKDTVSNSTSE